MFVILTKKNTKKCLYYLSSVNHFSIEKSIKKIYFLTIVKKSDGYAMLSITIIFIALANQSRTEGKKNDRNTIPIIFFIGKSIFDRLLNHG
jgi:hypothetical protein